MTTGTNAHSVRHGGPQLDTSKAARATMPAFPCRRCADRGWCGHGDRKPELWGAEA